MSSADRVTYDKRACARYASRRRVRMSTDGDAPYSITFINGNTPPH